MQNIGVDIGRGYSKIETLKNGKKCQILFKSIIGDGRTDNIDFDKYEDPICIKVEGKTYFVGELSEKESYSPIRNNRDDKTSKTVEILLCAALMKVATDDEVSIVLGVPNRSFNKKTLKEVVEKYQGKKYEITDAIENVTKSVTIKNITIFREADAAFIGLKSKGIVDDSKSPVGIVNIGFTTSEFAYFDKGGKFIDSLSDTYDYGNKDALGIVKDQLKHKNITKETFQIDSSDDYDDMKEVAYDIMSEKINQYVTDIWKNIDEMDIRVTGGTSQMLQLDKRYKVIDNPQMATCEGLYNICVELYGGEVDEKENE